MTESLRCGSHAQPWRSRLFGMPSRVLALSNTAAAATFSIVGGLNVAGRHLALVKNAHDVQLAVLFAEVEEVALTLPAVEAGQAWDGPGDLQVARERESLGLEPVEVYVALVHAEVLLRVGGDIEQIELCLLREADLHRDDALPRGYFARMRSNVPGDASGLSIPRRSAA